jgi:hypothetical protein
MPLLRSGLHAARKTGGEVGGLLVRPHHRARLRASADEFLDEGAADLTAGSGDEDGTQVSRTSHYVVLSSSQKHTAAIRTSENTSSRHLGE